MPVDDRNFPDKGGIDSKPQMSATKMLLLAAGGIIAAFLVLYYLDRELMISGSLKRMGIGKH
jgi:hypothetical protein